MDCQKLFSVIDELNDTYCNLWEYVCNIESPTDYKKGVDEVGNVFIKMANARGWIVEISEQTKAGNAICITINHTSKARPVVFSGHIDTVHPIGLFGTPAVRRDERCIYGPGVTDCKGGVVAAFMALDALDQCRFTDRPVMLIIQTDEETGSRTSGLKTVEFMCEKAKNAIAFLNTESIQGNSAVLVRKGILRYRFTVFGKAVHSANCAIGANAIAEAAHKILKLETLKDAGTLTCNCGTIEGGTVANTVADKCSFTADFRFSSEEDCVKAQRMVEEVSEQNMLKGCHCELKKISFRPAMPPCDRNFELLAAMNKIYKDTNLPQLTSRICLAGSDAAYTTQAGIPSVDNLGVDGGEIHTINEFAYLASLAASAKRLAAVACCI